MRKGYIKLYRCISDSEDWLDEPFTRGQAWVDMIMLANYKEGSFRVRGILVELSRGQLGWSEESLVKRWKWSRGKVRRFLSELESKQMQRIERQKNNVSSVITILNYDKYQSDDTADSTANDTPDGTASGTLTRIIKKNKNDKNTYTSDFLEFWELYPPQRREGKLKAFKSWQTLKPDLEQIKTALSWQKRSEQWTKDGGQFIPMPASYLNGKRWEDSPKAPLAQKEAYRWPTEAEIRRIGFGYEFSEEKIERLVKYCTVIDPNTRIKKKMTAIEIIRALGLAFDQNPDEFSKY